MQTITNDLALFFDVDNTLIRYASMKSEWAVEVHDAQTCNTFYVHPIEQHILILKRAKSRGRQIIVWSAGGSKWAETVVKALGLEELVDYCMSKPEVVCDDTPLKDWKTVNLFIDKWGD